MTMTDETPESRLPRCEKCDVKHPWLLRIQRKSEMVLSLEWKCNECGKEQVMEP